MANAKPTWTTLEDAPKGEMLADRFVDYRKPLANAGDTKLDISIVETEPGGSGPYHYHEDGVEECYIVLEGELSVEMEDETGSGPPGTVFFFPSGAPHRPFNDTDGTVKFISERIGEGGRTVIDPHD